MSLTLGDVLEAMAGFPEMEPSDFVRRGLLVIAPHPDDESLGCGGLIAACRAAGLPVSILIVSDGGGSHPGSALFPPAILAALRQQEAIMAAAALGVGPSHVHFGGLPDRSVPMSGYEAERACERIAALAAAADVVAVTWRHDPHGDHKASFALARAAVGRVYGASLWEYPIWGLTLPPKMALPGERPRGVRVRVADHLPAKRRAIAAHASQTTGLIVDDPKGFRLTPDMLARFDTEWETFIECPL